MATTLQNRYKEPHGKGANDEEEGENKGENLEIIKKGGKGGKKHSHGFTSRSYRIITKRILYA